jgi:hypothetical protein
LLLPQMSEAKSNVHFWPLYCGPQRYGKGRSRSQ